MVFTSKSRTKLSSSPDNIRMVKTSDMVNKCKEKYGMMEYWNDEMIRLWCIDTWLYIPKS